MRRATPSELGDAYAPRGKLGSVVQIRVSLCCPAGQLEPPLLATE
jgi:hypothetical protein